MPIQPTPADPTELTPKQSKAARALLAWSQQDLAKKAGVAASTVADFERGHRTPVPNNADAIRTALEGAGVHFLPGGALIGPHIPILGSDVSGGVPIRWVDASDLGDWATRRDGQAAMPTLIAKLVRAAHGPQVEIGFPSDESIQFAGWDGITKSDQESRYVPNGVTGWEIGTQQRDIAAKATADFEKRTAAPGEIDPRNATFIFVTPRPWPKRAEWAQQMQTRGGWHDVRAYDATDLIHWIELYPAVGQWLATLVRKRPPGVRQLEEVWQEWSLATQHPLSQDLILADRDEDAIAVLQWLRSGAAILTLQAESAEEAVAFAYAAINQLPPATAQHYLTRSLVAVNAEAARTLADSSTRLAIVLLDPEPGLAGRLVQRGHHVLLAYGGNTDQRGDYRRLARPTREAIEQALMQAGIAEPRARNLARDSSRSLAILRRLIPAAPGRLPHWADDTPPRGLLAAMLAGGWDERSDADKDAVSRLAGMPYADVAAEIAPLASAIDGPLRKVGHAWKVASPQDAWSLLAKHLAPADLERFRAVALDVLGAHDPRFDMDPEERWLFETKNVRAQYSGYLRHGVGEILILLALYGELAPNLTNPKGHADQLVRNILNGATRERWWSLSRDFQLLGEAAPMQFLDAIDDSLQRNDPPIRSLFGTDGGPFGGEHISDLLWALESLAWSPRNLGRVAETLARLDMIDPGGRFMNRPANSLSKIFSIWLPQTYATQAERIRLIDHLRRSDPAPAWKLLLAILPSGHGVITPSPHPRWRDFSPDSKEIVTWGLVRTGTEEVAARLLQDVGQSPERWKQVLKRINNLPDPKAVVGQLTDIEPRVQDAKDRAEFWETLRGVLSHHRQFPDAKWSLSPDDLDALEVIYHRFAPDDPVARIAWLFQPRAEVIDPGVEGWRSRQSKLIEVRQEALAELLEHQGVEGVFALARATDVAGWVGQTLVELKIDAARRDAILERALRSEDPHDRDLAHGLVMATFAQNKAPWAVALLAKAKAEKWGESATLTILRALPIDRWTWQQVEAAGAAIEAEYWKTAPALWMEGDADDLAFMADKLIEAGRARRALDLIGPRLEKKPATDLLVRILEAVIRQPWEKSGDSNDVTMFSYYVAEFLKVLDAARVSDDVLFRLEWAYMPVLEHSDRPPTVLIKALAERPSFFMEVLSALFRPSEESGIIEREPENPERAQAVASQAFDLLRQWDRVPGTMPDGRIDGAVLEAWVKEARQLANAAGRADIADQKIGEALSASPQDVDDRIWPARPVRDVVEIVRSKHLESGLSVGRLNRRGATSRLVGDGGQQERDLVKQYRDFSAATALEWPRTSAVLERIARSYEEDARRHDEDAERWEWHG
jgi:transcriptional regulator with XRE-family HTH domain